MTSASVETGGSRLSHWLVLSALVFFVQVGLIVCFSNRSPRRPRPPAPAPTFQLMANGPGELLSLHDPTLFALPHRQSFSGPAWLRISPMRFRSFDWSDPTNWLSVPVLELGAVFSRFIETNRFEPWQIPADPEPQLTLPDAQPVTASHDRSAVRLEGGLAKRRLLTPITLPPQTHTDLLNNSVVRVLVDGEGRPVSATLLLPGSGSKLADQLALEQTKAARFDSVSKSGPGRHENPLANVTWGDLVFRWQTLPIASTNAP